VTTYAYLPQEVCGVSIDNVGWDTKKGPAQTPATCDVNGDGVFDECGDPEHSAIEAICSVGKDHKIMGSQETQLVRQCTAAWLNFAVSEAEGGNCASEPVDGTLIGDAMAACCDADSACTGNPTTYSVEECIGIIDWFNNANDSLYTDVFTGLGAADSSHCRGARNNGTVVNPNP
jgi:hypothetical protein